MISGLNMSMTGQLGTLILGATLLSVLHGAIPNHWLPIIALARKQRWSMPKTLWGTLAAGTAHVTSTVAVGVVIGFLGIQLAQTWEHLEAWIGSAFLILFGLWILICQMRGAGVHIHWGPGAHPHPHPHSRQPHHQHESEHAHMPLEGPRTPALNSHGWSLQADIVPLGALALMMFVSPCLELDAYFLVAVQQGWVGIAAVAITYVVVTVATMMLIVWGVYSGLKWLQWNLLQRYEGYFSGGLLVALGLGWLLVKL